MHDEVITAAAAPATVARSAKSLVSPIVWALCAIGWSLSGCRGDDSGQAADTGGSSGSAGTAGTSTAGSAAGSTESGGGGAGGEVDTGADAAGGDDASAGGGAGDDDGGTTVAPLCVFHTDPPPVPEGGSDGAADQALALLGSPLDDAGDDGGAASDASSSDASDSSSARDSATDARAGDGAVSTTTISLQTSAFVGRYLADGAGRTLYIYAGDLPGDCNDPPVSNCDSTTATVNCAGAWPIFQGVPRILATGLSDTLFGTILRPDGLYQATYYGWPLYYYKNDTAPNVLTGQNRAKSWWAATVIPAGIVIMKDSAPTPQKYIADGYGRTLYTFAQDTKGTDATNPVSACTGSCLDNYQPFQRSRLSVVTSLEPTDFSIFVRGDSMGQQVAYKGAPLYHAVADQRAGQITGVAAPDWAVIPQ